MKVVTMNLIIIQEEIKLSNDFLNKYYDIDNEKKITILQTGDLIVRLYNKKINASIIKLVNKERDKELYEKIMEYLEDNPNKVETEKINLDPNYLNNKIKREVIRLKEEREKSKLSNKIYETLKKIITIVGSILGIVFIAFKLFNSRKAPRTNNDKLIDKNMETIEKNNEDSKGINEDIKKMKEDIKTTNNDYNEQKNELDKKYEDQINELKNSNQSMDDIINNLSKIGLKKEG